MQKISLLDLCCKAGGCSVGYFKAARELGAHIDIVGIDIEPQNNYPFDFLKVDALDFLRAGHAQHFTHIHASPPCQEYSRTKSLHRKQYADILAPCRELLQNTGRPYVIENVLGAKMKNAIILDGPMFGLRVIRRRKFESNVLILEPGRGYKNGSIGGKNCTVRSRDGYFITSGHQSGTLTQWRQAIGISWMQKPEIAEAIPPAFTHWIGLQLFKN